MIKEKTKDKTKNWDTCDGNCQFCFPMVHKACQSHKKTERSVLIERGKHKVDVELDIREVREFAISSEIYCSDLITEEYYLNKIKTRGIIELEEEKEHWDPGLVEELEVPEEQQVPEVLSQEISQEGGEING